MNIIPQPHKIVTGSPLDERYLVNKQVFTNTEGHLPRYLNEKLNLKVNRISLEKNYAILISRALNNYLPRLPEILLEQEEGYYLNMSRENVSIVSASERGLFYGIQTLLQIKSDHGLRETEITDWPDNRVRGFHLELRYGIPIQERVLQIIDELAYYKFNTLIIEYEDKFPFDKYSDIVSKNAFSAEQITEIQEYASNRYIDIIPLQQTLGHLEYILKNDQYNHLKELEYGGIESEYPFSINRETGFLHLNDIDEICPTNQASYELIDALCTEMALKHPGSRYFHIGCDEAWNILSCRSCKAKYAERGKKALFLDHVNRIADKIISLNKIPVIWDDMLRQFDRDDFRFLNRKMIIMCWAYFKRDFAAVETQVRRYREEGFKVIGAAAAKCSEGTNPLYLDVPNLEERLSNIEEWAKLTERTEIEGIITTAWSNYTGTIAAPHPFFDTIWYPVTFSAEKYWKTDANKAAFWNKFIGNYFGIDEYLQNITNDCKNLFRTFSEVYSKCKRNRYIAEIYREMSLLNIYRIKSMAIYRELYKLQSRITNSEKQIIIRKIGEVRDMRNYIKPRISETIGKYYVKEDIDEFINSRFAIDEYLYESILP